MDWKNKPVLHKIMFAISAVAVVLVAVGTLKPDLFPVNVSYPAISLFTLCEAVLYWKKNRKWSLLLIFAAVICIACFALELSLM